MCVGCRCLDCRWERGGVEFAPCALAVAVLIAAERREVLRKSSVRSMPIFVVLSVVSEPLSRSLQRWLTWGNTIGIATSLAGRAAQATREPGCSTRTALAAKIEFARRKCASKGAGRQGAVFYVRVICVYIYICIHTCIHIYIYIFIHIHTHTYYIHIHG